jgi:hypothetical protein
MNFLGAFALVSFGFLIGITVKALPNPLNMPPSFLKINSVLAKGQTQAADGMALVADGSTKTKWANVEGVLLPAT